MRADFIFERLAITKRPVGCSHDRLITRYSLKTDFRSVLLEVNGVGYKATCRCLTWGKCNLVAKRCLHSHPCVKMR